MNLLSGGASPGLVMLGSGLVSRVAGDWDGVCMSQLAVPMGVGEAGETDRLIFQEKLEIQVFM